jgi:DNA repair exonuclease SbcCD ATPase subunit
MSDDIKLENYRKSVAKILDIWGGKLEKIAKELAPIQAELDKLDESKPDDKKRIDELKKKCADLHKQVENANLELRLDFIDLDIPPKADDKELLKIPAWMKDIIKRKGLPLGKDVSIAPTVDFDFKAKKLKSFGIKITW